MFSPRTIGAPAKFRSFRSAQYDALMSVLDSDERFNAIVAPTGVGKSLLAWSIAAMTGERTLILTSTHHLANMYRDQFGDGDKIADVRGQQNYPCVAVQPGGPLQRYGHGAQRKIMCSDGPCHHGVRCALIGDGCSYYDAVRVAEQFDGAVGSNYSYWTSHGKALMHGRADKEPLGQFNVLVCDEAHNAINEVRTALCTVLEKRDLSALVMHAAPKNGKVGDWQKWAQRALPMVEEMASELKREVSMIGLTSITQSSLRRLRNVREGLDMVSGVDGDDWVLTEDNERVTLQCVHPHKYTERLLFRGVDKVVLMSATLTRKDCSSLNTLPRSRSHSALSSTGTHNRECSWTSACPRPTSSCGCHASTH